MWNFIAILLYSICLLFGLLLLLLAFLLNWEDKRVVECNKEDE